MSDNEEINEEKLTKKFYCSIGRFEEIKAIVNESLPMHPYLRWLTLCYDLNSASGFIFREAYDNEDSTKSYETLNIIFNELIDFLKFSQIQIKAHKDCGEECNHDANLDKNLN